MEFHYPRTVKEANSLLKKSTSIAVAGGTSFIGRPRVEHLVDLTKLGLNYIKNKKTEITIGATTTATEIWESKVLGNLASGILHAATSTMADTQLRNVITVGGNIACRYNWTCLPPALMALDAKVRIAGRKDRTLSIEEFLKSKLKPGEFIKEVIIPKKSNTGKSAYIKFTRTTFDYSLATVAVYAEKEGGKVSALRIAVSGITNPTRVKSIEDQLQGTEANEKSITEAAEKAAAQLPLTKTYLFSEDYRRELLGVLLRRALNKVLEEG